MIKPLVPSNEFKSNVEENPEVLPISDAEVLEIVQKLKTRDDLWFHLKNATRAHLLQIRLTIDSNIKAMKIIDLLKETK